MFSGYELQHFLRSIGLDVKFINFEFVSSEKFTTTVKCKVDEGESTEFYNDYSKEWIKKFSNYTSTTWIVRTCFPRLKRLVYRKVYVCHRSAFNKKKNSERLSKNQRCNAKIDFKIKFINRHTIKNDANLKEGLNMTITIDFTHTHLVRAPESFNLLKSTLETDVQFYGYFENGYQPMVAKSYQELKLIEKYGEDCSDYLENANLNPTLRHVMYIYGKKRKFDKNKKDKTFDEIMTKKNVDFENAGITIRYTTEPQIVVIITPIMKRAISEFNFDYIIVDSILVPNGPVTTFIYVPSKVGALPIACLLHMERSEANYSQAIFTVKLALENECHRNFEPKTLIVNECIEERNALTCIFPNSNIITSRTSLCCNIWRILNEEDMKLDRKKRHCVMVVFSSLIYAENLETAQKHYDELIQAEYGEATQRIRDYTDELWNKREEWIVKKDDRCEYAPLVDISVKFLNEFLLQKCKSFNICVICDVVTDILEKHQRRIIFSHVKGDKIVATYTKFLTKTKLVLGLSTGIQRINAKEFRIEYQSKPKKFANFRIDTMTCDCHLGKKGRYCEHLCAVINSVEIIKIPKLTEEECVLFTKLAGDELEEETKMLKPEVNEIVASDYYDEDDKQGTDEDEVIHDSVGFDDTQMSDSPKQFKDDDYVDIKTKKWETRDPLNEASDHEGYEGDNATIFLLTENTSKTEASTLKDVVSITKYESVLKVVNDEFRRLNKFFRENPNSFNMETMIKLARELSKIRPPEKVNLKNMAITLNSRKRKRQ